MNKYLHCFTNKIKVIFIKLYEVFLFVIAVRRIQILKLYDLNLKNKSNTSGQIRQRHIYNDFNYGALVL